MIALRRIGGLAAGILLVFHGIAHAPGALGSLKLATFEEVSYQPNLITSAGDGLVMLLGVLWFVAGAAFVVGGLGVALRRWFAARTVIVALGVSMPLTILWYQDAIAGLVVNGALAFVLALRAGLGGMVTRRAVPEPRVQ